MGISHHRRSSVNVVPVTVIAKRCIGCGIEINPLHRDLEFYCDCCVCMLGSIMTPRFKRWHEQEANEYAAQILAKKRLMNGVI
jgi:hypothetical protein